MTFSLRVASSVSVLLALTGNWACEGPLVEATPETIRMLAGGPVASDFVAAYQDSLPGVRISIQASMGSDYVVSGLEQGNADVGFAQADAVYQAYRTSLIDRSKPAGQLRGIALSESANVYIVVRRNSRHRTVTDLRGLKVGVFPKDTHASVYSQMIFGEYGLDVGSADFVMLRPDDMAGHLLTGKIDAATFGGPRIPDQMAQVNRSIGLRLLELSGQVVTRLRSRYPFFNPVLVSSAELPGQVGDVQTLGVDSLLVCRQDLDDERVYRLTRGFFEASRRAAQIAGTLSPANPDRSAATPIPLHPGAARYYREREVLQ